MIDLLSCVAIQIIMFFLLTECDNNIDLNKQNLKGHIKALKYAIMNEIINLTLDLIQASELQILKGGKVAKAQQKLVSDASATTAK